MMDSVILMTLILLCGANVKLSDSQVVQVCPGQPAADELSCKVNANSYIHWNGSAFTGQCPRGNQSVSDAIRVTDIEGDRNSTTVRCGKFVTENRLINTTDPNFPGEHMSILSTLSFVLNSTTLSGNVNILCYVAVQDNPEVNATIDLREIAPTNLSFDQSGSSQNFYWRVDNESLSECSLTFTLTITRDSFSPLIIPMVEGGVHMACPTLMPGDYEFFVTATSGTVLARSSPYQFSVSNMPQPITGVEIEISNKTCNCATITFTKSTLCDKYTIMAALRDASCREEKSGPVNGTMVYNFSGLEQGTTYCVCAIILDPANNNATICGNDLPMNGNFTTLAIYSGSIRVPYFQLCFILVANFLLWILFVL